MSKETPLSLSGDELLHSLYYNPDVGLYGIDKLYRQAKVIDKTITIKKVKEWLKNQETNQVLSRRKVKHEYPLTANWPFEKVQLDLLDLSNNSPGSNGNYKFLFTVIDVYSRFVICIPIKKKEEKECTDALIQALQEIDNLGFTLPSIITSDNESSFDSSTFKQVCQHYNIIQQYTEPGRKDETGIIERFFATLRRLISKYEIAFSTNKWIDVLPKLISNYNNSKHRTIKMSPLDALQNPRYNEMNYDRIRIRTHDANAQEYNQEQFQIGDKVRLLLKKSNFVKQTVRFTSTIHTIEKIEGSDYYVSDRVHPYKKKELMKIEKVERGPHITKEKVEKVREERTAEQKEKIINKRINKEGISKDTSTVKEVEEQANNRALRRYRRPRDLGFNILY